MLKSRILDRGAQRGGGPKWVGPRGNRIRVRGAQNHIFPRCVLMLKSRILDRGAQKGGNPKWVGPRGDRIRVRGAQNQILP